MSDVGELATIGGYITYTENSDFKTGTLRIKADTTIRIINGVTVTFDCEVLALEGKVRVDTHGEDGRNGIPGNDCPLDGWISGLSHNDHARRHREWVEALNTPNPTENGGNAIPGTDGTDAGHLIIKYRKLGDSADLGFFDQNPNTSGGRGGTHVAGGLGRMLICGSPSHSGHEQVRRPSGADWSGLNGRDGSFELQRVDRDGKVIESKKLRQQTR